MMNPAVRHLLSLQSGDGGFGPYPGASSRTEATALAALALLRSADEGTDGAATAAFGWLERYQSSSGAWPLAPDLPGPSWSTSLAVLALSHVDPGSPPVLAGARWLLGQKGRGARWWVRLMLALSSRPRAVELDVDLTGWPWVEGTFSWVEPTSYAMLALARLRGTVEDLRLEDRLAEGGRMLLDRVCAGGGWNYGNTRVFGEDLWPYPDTTSAALLALAHHRGLPAVERGLDSLERMLEQNDSLLAQSTGILALETHGRETGDRRSSFRQRLEQWEGGEVRALAWAALALSETEDVLGVGVRGG